MRTENRIKSIGRLTVPIGPMLLGIAGTIPFVGAVAIVMFGPPRLVETATFSLLAYGAVILSFLGGILWGSVLARGFTDIGNDHIRLLVISVLPSLCGWVALLAGPNIGLPLMAIAFLFVLVVDLMSTRDGLLPPWYPRLRIPLTISVALLLFIPCVI